MINAEEELRAILERSRTIAVVGLSPRPERPSNGVARYLIASGYRVIPVNPGHREILGLTCYPNLRAISEPVDIANCFRRSELILPIAEDAIAIRAQVLWMQLGIDNPAAAQRAEEAGLAVVANRCIKIDHMVLGIGRSRSSGGV